MAKRMRSNDCAGLLADDEHPAATPPAHGQCLLLGLPHEQLELIMGLLSASELSTLACTARAFTAWDRATGLKLVQKIARQAVLDCLAQDAQTAERWRRRTWLQRLAIEEAGAGFHRFRWSASDTTPSPCLRRHHQQQLAPPPVPPPVGPAAAGEPAAAQPLPPLPGAPPAAQQAAAIAAANYRFLPASDASSFLHIKLDGMGPKLLVSEQSTADQPLLRWRMAIRGNTAVEFGVVPLCMAGDDKALHKCQQEEKKFDRLFGPLVEAQRPTGFCSAITVGSMLPFKTSIMKGSTVELLARRGRLEIIITNPPDGQELYWHNTRTIPKPYKGPLEVRFEQDFSPLHDVKIALTSWAHGAFDVLHPAPGTRLACGRRQRAWHLRKGAEGGADGGGGGRASKRLARTRSNDGVALLGGAAGFSGGAAGMAAGAAAAPAAAAGGGPQLERSGSCDDHSVNSSRDAQG